MFELTRAMTTVAARPAYEVSNHARPGEESRHNLAYWRYQDYLGVGPGAHGRRLGEATQRHRKPENWLAAVGRNGHGLEAADLLTPEQRATEALVMGLRLDEGVDLTVIAGRTGIALDDLVDQRAAANLIGHGLLSRNGARLRVTESGMLLLDRILAEVAGDFMLGRAASS
jgi:oxygen-independent coproporphyrinogen-3 oxidase